MTGKRMAKGLTEAQQRFADEYLVDFNAQSAYLRAGYKARGLSARVHAFELLRHPKVIAYLAEQKKEITARVQFDQDDALRIAIAQGAGDARKLFDPKGGFRPIHELSYEEQLLVQAVEVEEVVTASGEVVGRQFKYKFLDRGAALQRLGLQYGLFARRIEHTGKGGGAIKVERSWLDDVLDGVNGAGTGLPPPQLDAPGKH